ncbi:hypothetical protein TSOC111612_11745 [Tsukamurella ocularis]
MRFAHVVTVALPQLPIPTVALFACATWGRAAPAGDCADDVRSDARVHREGAAPRHWFSRPSSSPRCSRRCSSPPGPGSTESTRRDSCRPTGWPLRRCSRSTSSIWSSSTGSSCAGGARPGSSSREPYRLRTGATTCSTCEQLSPTGLAAIFGLPLVIAGQHRRCVCCSDVELPPHGKAPPARATRPVQRNAPGIDQLMLHNSSTAVSPPTIHGHLRLRFGAVPCSSTISPVYQS